MPHDIREALTELEEDLRKVRLAPAADVRAQGRRRTVRRQTAVGGSALLLVAAATAGTLVMRQDSGPVTEPAMPVAPLGCAVPADLTLPDSVSEVEVRVIDGAGRVDRVDEVVRDMRNRTLRAGPGTAGSEELPAGTVAMLRYGPSAVGKATLVQAYLLNQAQATFVPARTEDTVDVVIGPAFQQLATTTEVNRSLAAISPDDLPHRC